MEPVFHFELPADDMKRAKAFYERAFGWNIDPSFDRYYWALTTKSDNQRNAQNPGGINGAIQQRDSTITSTRIAIEVSDLDEALKKVVAEGGKIFIPKKKLPRSYYSVIYDTEGNEVMLVEKIK